MDSYWHLEIYGGKSTKEIERTYFSLLDAFGNIGGVIEFFVIFISFLYASYNEYVQNRHIILKVLIGKESLYDKHLSIRNDYKKLNCRPCLMKSCCNCCQIKKKMKSKEFEDKYEILEAANEVIQETMEIRNFIVDSIDFQAMRHIILKSRHRQLMPLLIVEYQRKKRINTKGKYHTSFARNLYEAVDTPVFTLEDAISKIKDVDANKSEIEQAVDEWFVDNQPKHILLSDIFKSSMGPVVQ